MPLVPPVLDAGLGHRSHARLRRQAAGGTRQAAIDAFVASDLGRAEKLAGDWLSAHPRDAEIHHLLGLVRLSTALGAEAQGPQPGTDVLAIYGDALRSLLEAERLAAGRAAAAARRREWVLPQLRPRRVRGAQRSASARP